MNPNSRFSLSSLGRLTLMAAALGFAAVPLQAQNTVFQSSQPYSISGIGGSPELVTPLDTFQISLAGFNATGTGAFILSPITATFGLTQSFVTNGQTVTVSSSETIGATTTTDTITFSVPTNFLPAGTTIGGTAVTQLQLDLGRLNAGTNMLDFTLPVTGLTASGVLLFNTTSSLALTPTVQLNANNTAVGATEGVNAGGADLSTFLIRSFSVSFTYANIPEPSTWAFLVTGGAAALVTVARRRRA